MCIDAYSDTKREIIALYFIFIASSVPIPKKNMYLCHRISWPIHAICPLNPIHPMRDGFDITIIQPDKTMTHQEQRNRRLADTIIRQLQRRHITAYYCPTSDEAVQQVSALIDDGSSVTWGGSMTIRDLGISECLKRRASLNVIDRDTASSPEERLAMYRSAFSADYYLSSANAISEDGVIVNIDGNGNRVAAITWGPAKVIFVIGLNKVAQTVEAALMRARSTAAPTNAARFDIQTPCLTDGVCHNCHSSDCICNYVHFLRNSPNGRHIVVLVGEGLGY